MRHQAEIGFSVAAGLGAERKLATHPSVVHHNRLIGRWVGMRVSGGALEWVAAARKPWYRRPTGAQRPASPPIEIDSWLGVTRLGAACTDLSEGTVSQVDTCKQLRSTLGLEQDSHLGHERVLLRIFPHDHTLVKRCHITAFASPTRSLARSKQHFPGRCLSNEENGATCSTHPGLNLPKQLEWASQPSHAAREPSQNADTMRHENKDATCKLSTV